MLHQVSSGYQGVIQDIEISFQETNKYNEILFGLLGEYTDKPAAEVKKDADRDFWLDGKEAVKYGIVDKLILKKDK
jgi:ATP-dependent Clp protease protease subunit